MKAALIVVLLSGQPPVTLSTFDHEDDCGRTIVALTKIGNPAWDQVRWFFCKKIEE